MKWLWQYFEYWFGLSWALNFSVKLLGYVSCHPYAAGITCSADRVVLHTSCLRGLGKKKHCLNGFWSVEWTWKGPMTSERERERGVLLGAHIYTDLGELEMTVMITCVWEGAWIWIFFLQRAEAHIAYTGDGYVNTLQVIFVWEKHSVTSCGWVGGVRSLSL